MVGASLGNQADRRAAMFSLRLPASLDVALAFPAHGKGTGLEKAAESDVWATSGGGPQRVCLHPIGKDRSPGCP